MDFNFIIDKNYLLLKMISNRNNIEELKKWKNNVIINLLGKKIIYEIEIKKENIEEYFIRGEFHKALLNNNLNFKISKIMEDNLFNKYYNESIEYLNLIQKNWLNFKDKINKWLKETIKMQLSEKTISVYVSHPKLNTGKCVDQKYIFWGHLKGITDINYNITYLCHENLHTLLPNDNCMPPAMKLYYDKDDKISSQEQWDMLNSSIEDYYKIFDFEFNIIHTVIELISDNELYTILNDNSKYVEGHNSLVKYKELILPYWFEYLNLSSMEIKERIPNFVNKTGRLSNTKMNLDDFINFLTNNSNIRSKLEIPDLIYQNLKNK